jgi:hypothetical protein
MDRLFAIQPMPKNVKEMPIDEQAGIERASSVEGSETPRKYAGRRVRVRNKNLRKHVQPSTKVRK